MKYTVFDKEFKSLHKGNQVGMGDGGQCIYPTHMSKYVKIRIFITQ